MTETAAGSKIGGSFLGGAESWGEGGGEGMVGMVRVGERERERAREREREVARVGGLFFYLLYLGVLVGPRTLDVSEPVRDLSINT